MLKVKYFLVKNKIMVMILFILLICSIAIAFGVYSQITNKGFSSRQPSDDLADSYQDLKDNFKDIFTNKIEKSANANLRYNYDEIIYCKYNIEEEKVGQYKINAQVPFFKLESDVIQKVNKEIFDTFARKIIDIATNSSVYKIYNLDYVAYVNGDIISLVIRCNYKDGTNAQRTIIQTYNYDIEKDKLLNIDDILEYKKLNKDKVQKKIFQEIQEINNKMKDIKSQGYNVYLRNEGDKIYEVKNTANYFLGKSNYLYLVYAYGNNNFTSDIDLVIF